MSAIANLAKVKNLFNKISGFLSKHSFLTFLILFMMESILGALIFYKYNILVLKKEPQVSEKANLFKEKDYQNILNILQEREKKFQEAELRSFLNPFQEMRAEVPSVPGVEQEQELKPEIPLENLQTAINLYKFYLSKGEILPPIAERAMLWEELGLGKVSEYYGTIYQNQKLLEELKKIFSPMP